MKVFVPAFPRSGTSFLTNLISKMGFNLGPENQLKSPDKNNPYGYFESLPIMNICFEMLSKLNGDYFYNIPHLNDGWKEKLTEEKEKVISLINEGEIELIKNGPILIIADLFYEIYPNAKWILITRDINETYRSRFGKAVPFHEWEIITERRLMAWYSTQASKEALEVKYSDFFNNFDKTCSSITDFLNVDLTSELLFELRGTFKPRTLNNN